MNHAAYATASGPGMPAASAPLPLAPPLHLTQDPPDDCLVRTAMDVEPVRDVLLVAQPIVELAGQHRPDALDGLVEVFARRDGRGDALPAPLVVGQLGRVHDGPGE